MKHFRTPPHTPGGATGVGIPVRDTHREISDFYVGIIIELEPRWRVIICKAGIQWILQKRSSKYLNKGVWLGESYCTARDALICVCSSRGLLSDPKARAVLELLPKHARDWKT